MREKKHNRTLGALFHDSAAGKNFVSNVEVPAKQETPRNTKFTVLLTLFAGILGKIWFKTSTIVAKWEKRSNFF